MRLLSVLAQCFLTGALLMAQGQPTPDGSIQARNKAVAMRVFDEIFNQGKFEVDGSWRSGSASVKRGPTFECSPI